MELQRELTLEMVNEDLAGTTFTTYSGALKLGLTAVYDPYSKRLGLLIRSGESVWQSDWLECGSQLGTAATVAHIREAVRLWLLLTGLPSRGQRSSWTPLELASRTIAQFEHVLA